MKFTIVMTVFGRESYALRALHCILSQSVKDWELVIMADGPHPDLRRSLQSVIDDCQRPITYKAFPEAQGAWGNPIRRAALVDAKGEYTVFVGHDCLIDKDYLAAHEANIALTHVNCLSVVPIRYWHLRAWQNVEQTLPIEEYRGVIPATDEPIREGNLDLLCVAWPTAIAKREAFHKQWHRLYTADWHSFKACRESAPVVVHPGGPVGAHF